MGSQLPRHFITAFLIVLFVDSWAYAQSEDTAVIVGTVSDPSGAVLPSATAHLTHVTTDTSYTVTTNQDGYYRTPPLKIGEYVLAIQAPGFKRLIRRGVVLEIGDIREVDVHLEVGQASESVSVTAEAPLLETVQGSAGTVVENKLVTELPLNGRDYLQLAKISSGVSDPGSQQGALGVSVNGSMGTQVNFLIDGVDNNSQTIASQGLQKETLKPQIDAVQEFKIETNSYSAEYGRSMGGVVLLLTKSGTNDYHGTAFYFGRNDVFDARNFFTPSTAPKPPYKRDQYGFSIGGPIKKNKIFFFGDVQWTNIRQSQINVNSVPPLAWRQGQFVGAGAPIIYDPLTYNASTNTRQPFPNNTIPVSRFDSVTSRVMNWWPAPQSAAAANNYTWVPPVREDDLNWDFRYDETISSKDNFYFRFSRQDRNQPRVPNLPDSSDGLQKQGQNADYSSYQTALVYNHVFTPNFMGSVRAGWNMLGAYYTVNEKSVNPIIGVNENNGLDTTLPGSATFSPSGFTGLGVQGSQGNSFTTDISQTRQESADFTWVHGRHSIKFGQAIFWLQSYLLQPTGSLGGFSFNGQYTRQPSTGAAGQPFADFLLGLSTGFADENLRFMRLRAPWIQEYVQDDFKVNNRLSLNLGLRYEINLPWVEKGNRIANFDIDTNPANPQIVVAGSQGSSWEDRALQKVNLTNLAPRFGFAYRLGENNVVRGGYGVFYGNLMNTGGGQFMELNPPFHLTVSQSFNPVVPSFQVQNGLPPGNLSPGNAPALAMSSFQRNGKFPIGQQWNFNIQRQLPANMLFQIGYFGSKDNHLIQMYDLNYAQPGPGSINPRRRYTSTLIPGTNSSIALAATNGFRYNANSLYHSMQTRLEKRFSNGLSFMASYTWSKDIGDAGWMPGESAPGGYQSWGVQDPTNLREERSLLPQDLRHNFVGSWVYELPFGKGKAFGSSWGRSTNALFGRWSMSGIASIRSGFPMNLTVVGDPLNTGESDRPNVVGDQHLAHPTVQQWFNTAAFAKNAPYQFGDTGRYILTSPGLTNFDMGIFKSFLPMERVSVQFRAEAFNIFNTPPLGFANTSVGTAAFGTITSAGPPRNLQLALKIIF
jgi:hypothetical protein